MPMDEIEVKQSINSLRVAIKRMDEENPMQEVMLDILDLIETIHTNVVEIVDGIDSDE